MSDQEIDRIEGDIESAMDEAVEFAKASDELSFDEFMAIVEGY
jgi:TPP-dependent pyruvate/acetoin dehydrogenase alpha subunit